MGVNSMGPIGNNQVKLATNGGGRTQSAVADVPNSAGNARFTSSESFPQVQNVQLVLGENSLGESNLNPESEINPGSEIAKSFANGKGGSSVGYNRLTPGAKEFYNALKNVKDLSIRSKEVLIQIGKAALDNTKGDEEFVAQLRQVSKDIHDAIKQIKEDRYALIASAARGPSGTA
jgi:hypothetical protein